MTDGDEAGVFSEKRGGKRGSRERLRVAGGARSSSVPGVLTVSLWFRFRRSHGPRSGSGRSPPSPSALACPPLARSLFTESRAWTWRPRSAFWRRGLLFPQETPVVDSDSGAEGSHPLSTATGHCREQKGRGVTGRPGGEGRTSSQAARPERPEWPEWPEPRGGGGGGRARLPLDPLAAPCTVTRPHGGHRAGRSLHGPRNPRPRSLRRLPTLTLTGIHAAPVG